MARGTSENGIMCMDQSRARAVPLATRGLGVSRASTPPTTKKIMPGVRVYATRFRPESEATSLPVVDSTSWDEVQAAAAKAFGLERLVIKIRDLDDDVVTITTAASWTWAHGESLQKHGVVRILVYPVPAPQESGRDSLAADHDARALILALDLLDTYRAQPHHLARGSPAASMAWLFAWGQA